jgi:hypothetical protein
MHLLRLFLMTWVSVGIVAVFFLFWLCKRTAATAQEPGGLVSFSSQLTDSSSGEVRAA